MKTDLRLNIWFWGAALTLATIAGIAVTRLATLSLDISGGLLVFGLVIVLTALVAIGLRTRGILGALLLVQAGYWILSFIVRPLVLLIAQPTPRFGDPVADNRLYRDGYPLSLGNVLTPILIGLFTYVVFMLFSARRAQGWGVRTHISPTPLYAVLAVGWMFRFGQLALPSNSLLITFSFVGSVAVGGLILLTEKRPSTKLLLALVATEFLWSYLSAVKAPIFAAILWIAIRQLVDNRKFPIKQLFWLLLAAAVSFIAVQNAKIAIGRLDDTSRIGDFYPVPLQPILPIVNRFDLLNAATDASYAGPSSWMSPGEALSYALQAFIPQQLSGIDKGENVGRLWGSEVSRLSRPDVTGQTFLAQNPAAEGWVIGGWTGTIAECLIVAAVVILTARFLHSKFMLPALLGLAVTSQPYIFERGALGIAEGFGKGIQVALLAAAIIMFTRLKSVDGATTSGTVVSAKPERITA